ncbi:uncharacterized protein TNCV_1948791 [Trichonephila clavipes]|nr:uncharacterized protein TNCV_1948791 [Trichonephila clavipes]
MGKKGDLSPSKKAEVKAHVNAKLFSNHEISRRLQVSEASVRRIKKKIEFATTIVIKPQLQDINVNASERTVRRKLKDLNFKTCCPTKKPKLTPTMKAKRLNWAKQWRVKDKDSWRSVCFSDESTFEILQNKAQFVRRRRGEKFHSDCIVQTVKHPTKIMIWSVISGKGTGRLYMVKGMMQQDQYKDVLKNRLIPQLEEWFPNGEPYIFMQDGAPCYTARSIKVFWQKKISLCWIGRLLERMIHVLNHHPQMQETVQSRIDSMPRRIEVLITAKVNQQNINI